MRTVLKVAPTHFLVVALLEITHKAATLHIIIKAILHKEQVVQVLTFTDTGVQTDDPVLLL